MTIKRSGSLATSEAELAVDGKIKDHHRKQRILDSATKVACYTILIFPPALVALALVSLIHEVFIKGNWEFLLSIVKYCAVIFVSYLSGFLSKNGITPKE